jgi:uncharacterized protein YggE
MTAQPSISVRGEATIEVDPEIAVVSAALMARDTDRHRAVDLLTRRHSRVMALLKGHGGAIEKIESGAVNVHPEFKPSKIGGKIKERIAGYIARGSVEVTVGDFTILGDLVAGLASEEMVAVSGPWWRLRPGSPVHRQARLAAAQDALRRAREYAEAFGGRVAGLSEVADGGLLTDTRQPVRMRAMAAGGAAIQAAEQEELDFEPAKQTVRAQVEARFTMTPPDFGAGAAPGG